LFTASIYLIVLAIAVVSWTGIARLTRAEFMKIKEREYVLAERAMGARNTSIMWKVILPNALPPLIVAVALGVGVAILFEAALSFLGLGDPNAYSWGYMIGSSREYIWDSWWTITFPGIAIFLTVLGISLIGDGLNDALNPKLREL
ncbi:MAG: ABC transporter permease, partial [Deltaproteobacteria bacterium]|nr:ABC transporter permease [Deltaproteobacteria bacterium]